jgi:hypothetical protein
MSTDRSPLWDAQRQDSYLKQRDAALERKAAQRDGSLVARNFDSVWATLEAQERAALEYLILSGARACVGRCNDALLLRLIDKGLLIWPPGVRPVLTDDLVTTFLVPPTLYALLEQKRDLSLPPPALREQRRLEAATRFGQQLVPLVTAEAADPVPPPAREQRQ